MWFSGTRDDVFDPFLLFAVSSKVTEVALQHGNQVFATNVESRLMLIYAFISE